MMALSTSGTKGKGENLECPDNYDARSMSYSHGKRKLRGHSIV